MEGLRRYIKKVIIDGDAKVGKTAFANVVAPKEPYYQNDPHRLTRIKVYHLYDVMVGLHVFDNPYPADLTKEGLFDVFYTNANGLIYIFDPSNKESISTIPDKLELISKRSKTEYIDCILAGNMDLVASETEIPPPEEIEHWIQDIMASSNKIRNIHFTQISLKNNMNLDIPLNLLVAGFIDRKIRCMNCFKEFNEIKIINYTAFCCECAENPDFDKVDAFYRLNDKSTEFT